MRAQGRGAPRPVRDGTQRSRHRDGQCRHFVTFVVYHRRIEQPACAKMWVVLKFSQMPMEVKTTNRCSPYAVFARKIVKLREKWKKNILFYFFHIVPFAFGLQIVSSVR